MSMLFGEPEGVQVGVDEDGFTKTTRADLLSYMHYLDGVEKKGPGFEARLIVPTGEPMVTRSGKRTGRGKDEMKHDRAFRQVAAERQQGIRIVPERLPDGTTMLRISLTKKREFSDLTNARRDRGRINYQAGKAIEKARKAKAAGEPEAAELEAKARELFAQVKTLDTQIAKLEAEEAAQAQENGAAATPKPPAKTPASAGK